MGGGTKNDEPRRLSDIREDPSASRNFKVAATRVGHAKQLKGTYAKVENDLVEYLGLNPEHMSIDGSLEHFLGLEDNKTASVEEIETKIHSLLPHIAKGYADCISCGRLKDVRRLAAKLETEDRDTHDVWGTQYWLADPNLMDKLVKLESPQHPLRKKWAEKGFDVTFDNHCSEPKSHGYRAFHINITCPGNNAWKEDAEFQFFPSTMMLPYFSTRGAYEAYRNIEEYEYTLMEEYGTCNNKENGCYKLVSKPKDIDSEYSYHITWVTKDNFLSRKTMMTFKSVCRLIFHTFQW